MPWDLMISGLHLSDQKQNGEIHSNTTVRATGEHGVQTMTITIATALPALVLSLFGALVGWLRKNRQSSLSINP
ncbi:hemicentin-2-like [Huso huso]|uniref:Hemicentin-2-like n=1 Tax=Huso huso TaxID=61971 RepID=A0ABR0Y152_HUSHU